MIRLILAVLAAILEFLGWVQPAGPTTQQQIPGPVWTGEVPAIYRAVRDVNRTLPRERQMRALLGDPPIDWRNVHTPAEFRKWLELRDSYPADLIQREVIAKGRRALV